MRLSSMIRRFRRREDGTVTVEFVILVPLIFAIFIATLEIGMMMSRWSGLDRAADMVIRSLRLGQYQNPTALLLRQEICDEVLLVENCFENIAVDIRRINRATFLMPDDDEPCVTRDQNIIQPVTQVTPGQQNDLMLIRVCIAVDALFPTSRYALPITLDAQGGYALSVASVYVNEPS
jgi:Flp pilus assembly pilin Flp